MRLALLIGSLVMTVFVAACGASAPAQPAVDAGQKFAMQVNDTMQFQPASIAIPAGQPFELTLENVGPMTHDFSLSEGVAQPVTIEVKPGESSSATFTIDKPGAYSFVCNQPAHALAGMRGTIVVR
jgi:uncharacterized cupredoxin-like copper-binding protein